MDMQQLPLAISLPESAVFANYIVGDNALAVALCQQLAEGRGDKQLLLWGQAAVGKSHLLQASCSAAASHAVSASYIPLAEVMPYGTEILQGLQQQSLVCVDDVQLCAGQRDWELALFNLLNACRDRACHLLLSANNSPSQLGVELPDLRSRLGWGTVVQLHELDEANKSRWLQQRAAQQGLDMPEDVVRYLLRHYPRDMHSQNTLLKQLNITSLATQRRLSVPFVKESLSK